MTYFSKRVSLCICAAALFLGSDAIAQTAEFGAFDTLRIDGPDTPSTIRVGLASLGFTTAVVVEFSDINGNNPQYVFPTGPSHNGSGLLDPEYVSFILVQGGSSDDIIDFSLVLTWPQAWWGHWGNYNDCQVTTIAFGGGGNDHCIGTPHFHDIFRGQADSDTADGNVDNFVD